MHSEVRTISQGAFSFLSRGEFQILQCEDAVKAGFNHGFIGTSADFSVGKNRAVSALFCETMEVSHLVFLNQVHSKNVLILHEDENEPQDRLSIQSEEADAVIAKRSSRARPYSIGIRTADCVPLLVQAREYCAAIHAGWRGLAQGIIDNTFRTLLDLESRTQAKTPSKESKEWLVLIGPCAGRDSYEIGAEILPKFQSAPVVLRKGEKIYLDLAATASAQVEESLTKLNQAGRIYLADTCTIQNHLFHSHRRDQENRGSNMSYVIL